MPEKGDTYVVPLRFLFLFLGGLFSLFISGLIGWSGAGDTNKLKMKYLSRLIIVLAYKLA